MHFIANETVGERLLPLGHKDGFDVVLDFQTGKETYIARISGTS
jgi:hypothetical protein